MDPRLERYADLIINFGANVQPDQVVSLRALIGHEEAARAIAVAAYRRGAKFVDVNYWDPHLKRARVQYADEDVLDFVPAWYGERTLQLGEARAASILLSGPIEPHLFDDLDPGRLGRRAQLEERSPEALDAFTRRGREREDAHDPRIFHVERRRLG